MAFNFIFSFLSSLRRPFVTNVNGRRAFLKSRRRLSQVAKQNCLVQHFIDGSLCSLLFLSLHSSSELHHIRC